jgi:hypothetical protein
MIGYNVLGISAHKLEPEKEQSRYRVFVAWQSNLPDCRFAWRCTHSEVNIVTLEAVQSVAARGMDVTDQKLVKKLFPYLDTKQLSH